MTVWYQYGFIDEYLVINVDWSKSDVTPEQLTPREQATLLEAINHVDIIPRAKLISKSSKLEKLQIE